MKKTVLIFLTLFMSIIFSQSALANPAEYQAFTEYDNGNYQRAIELLETSVASKEELSGLSHYNLGNFYFKNGKIGKAIFHYKKGQELMPRDGDLKFNLEYAQKKATDKIENLKSPLVTFFSLKTFFNKREQIYLLTFLFVSFWILMSINLLTKLEWARWALIFFVLSFFFQSAFFLNDFVFKKKFGVVTATEANIYSATGRDNILLFTLHEGAEFEITDELGEEWIQIILADNKRGWIKAESIAY